MSEPLTAYHVALFRRQGYLVREQMYDRAGLALMRLALADLIGQSMVATALPEGVPFLLLETMARVLLGGDVTLNGVNYFDKPPGTSRETPPHQDAFYARIDPPEGVQLWIALDAAGKYNGCLRYVAGSHKHGLRHHRLTDYHGFSQGIHGYPTEWDAAHEQPVSVAAGDVIAHHALTIHRAEANTSKGHRRALGLFYLRTDVVEDLEALQTYQRQLELERP